MPTVFSKLANSQRYTEYLKGGADVLVLGKQVHVHGGANLANHHLVTPLGVPTTVTDDEAEALEQNPIFKTHKKNGFITIEYNARASDVDQVVSDMGDKVDPSAPLTPSEYEDADGVISDSTNGKAKLSFGKKR